MKVEQFAMERMQSTYENQVELNLSESGVHPLRLGELVDDPRARDALLQEGLKYTQSNSVGYSPPFVEGPKPVTVTPGGTHAVDFVFTPR